MRKLLEATLQVQEADDIWKDIKARPPYCANYRKDTEQCRTGCEQGKAPVAKGDACPYADANAQKLWCPCYK